LQREIPDDGFVAPFICRVDALQINDAQSLSPERRLSIDSEEIEIRHAVHILGQLLDEQAMIVAVLRREADLSWPDDHLSFAAGKLASDLIAGNNLDVPLAKSAAASDLYAVGQAGLRRHTFAKYGSIHLKRVTAEMLADISANSIAQDDVGAEVTVKCCQILKGMILVNAGVYASAL